jgi:hypothetical protein
MIGAAFVEGTVELSCYCRKRDGLDVEARVQVELISGLAKFWAVKIQVLKLVIIYPETPPIHPFLASS